MQVQYAMYKHVHNMQYAMYERMLIADNWLVSLTVSLLEHVYTDEDISQDYED